MQRKDLEQGFYRIKETIQFPFPETDNPPVVAPLFDSIKYSFKNPHEVEKLFQSQREGFLYSRFENPNSAYLKKLLAAFCERDKALLLPSGLASITHCLDSLSAPGDSILCFFESYSPTKAFIQNELSKKGVNAILCHLDDKDSIREVFEKQKPKICIFEQQTNPQLKICDRDFILDLCETHNCISVVDATYDAFLKAPEEGIDVVIHSLSKFASGHSDIMGGCICTSRSNLFEKMDQSAKSRGIYLDPYVSRQTARSLETYLIRHLQYLENTKLLAKKLEEEKCFVRLKHPSLKDFSQKDLADRYQIQSTTIFAGLANEEQLYSFIGALKLIRMSPSLGCNESLIAPAKLFYGHGMSEDELKKSEIIEGSFRLSIGLESPELLFADIQQALEKL